MDRPENISNLSWFVLRVISGAELKTERELLEKDFPAFCPINIHRKRKSRYCHKYEMRPLARFLSYVFLGAGSHVDWDGVFKVPSVRAVLTFGRRPIAVPANQMAKVFEQSGTLDEAVDRICVGSTVEVIEGPFVGLGTSKVEEMRQSDVKVLLNVVGNFRSVVMPLEFLQLVRLDPSPA